MRLCRFSLSLRAGLRSLFKYRSRIAEGVDEEGGSKFVSPTLAYRSGFY